MKLSTSIEVQLFCCSLEVRSQTRMLAKLTNNKSASKHIARTKSPKRNAKFYLTGLDMLN